MSFSKNQLILFGLTAHVLAAFFSIGAHQADEIFQVFEFAGYKIGLNSAAELPWEFHEQMRSGIQPMIAFVITKTLNAFSIQNPFTVASIIRMLQALFSFIVTVQLLKFLEKEIVSNSAKLWLWAFGLLFWCLPYFHARFSSENFSETIFIWALLLVLKPKAIKSPYVSFLTAGLLFGIAFVCRFQLCFMILGVFGWLMFFRKTKILFFISCFIGIIFALGVGLLVDYWLYGKWTLSWWNYLDLNLFQNKASVFGSEPFYFYFEQAFLQLIPPFSLIIIFCVIAFWLKFKTHFITWVTLPFILLHFFVNHKELRFLFPVLNFLPFMLIYYFEAVPLSQNKSLLFIKTKRFMRFAVIVNIIALCYYTLKPASNSIQTLNKIYDLVKGASPVLLFDASDPYNNLASLHYFRNPAITTVDLKTDSIKRMNIPLYYFSEKFNESEHIVVQDQTFIKIYSNFPSWFQYLNFNGWLGRAGTYSIYRRQD